MSATSARTRFGIWNATVKALIFPAAPNVARRSSRVRGRARATTGGGAEHRGRPCEPPPVRALLGEHRVDVGRGRSSSDISTGVSWNRRKALWYHHGGPRPDRSGHSYEWRTSSSRRSASTSPPASGSRTSATARRSRRSRAARARGRRRRRGQRRRRASRARPHDRQGRGPRRGPQNTAARKKSQAARVVAAAPPSSVARSAS